MGEFGMEQCPECKSTKVGLIGFDIYGTDDGDVIEENQYRCYGCKIFIFQDISLKEGLLPIRIHKEKDDGRQIRQT